MTGAQKSCRKKGLAWISAGYTGGPKTFPPEDLLSPHDSWRVDCIHIWSRQDEFVYFGVAVKFELKLDTQVFVNHCNTSKYNISEQPLEHLEIPTDKVALTRKLWATFFHVSSNCRPHTSVTPAADWTHDRGSLSVLVRKALLTASRGQQCGLDRTRGCFISGDKLLWSVIHGKTRSQRFILHTVSL